MLPRRSRQPFLVAAFVLLAAGSASAAPWGVPWPCPLRARPVSCACAAFAFVRLRARREAGRLHCCFGAGGVVCELRESSRETAFSGDESVTGSATWFETESGDNELVLSAGTRLIRSAARCSHRSWYISFLDSFLWVKQQKKELIFWSTVLEGCSSKSSRIFRVLSVQRKKKTKLRGKLQPISSFFQQALREVELPIFICNVAVFVAFQQFQVKFPVGWSRNYSRIRGALENKGKKKK